jgi:beta-lactamase class A
VQLGVVRSGVALVAIAGFLGWAAMPAPLAGTVVDAGGHPVAGATVSAASWPLGQATVRTDASGAYHLLGHVWPLEAGVTVSAPGFRTQRTDGGRLLLHRWPWVSGSVSDDAGQAVAGAAVTVLQGGRRWRAISDESGRFGLAAKGVGAATVTVAAPNHDPATKRVRLGADRLVAVAPVLTRHLGTLALASDPPGTALLVDGKPAPGCPATPCSLALTAGRHQVSAPDAFLPWSQAVVVARGQSVGVHAQLTRKTGTLKVGAPAGELLLDGTKVAGGAWTAAVPTGHHTLVFRSAATWPETAGADVAWNQVTEVGLQPHPVVPGDSAAFAAELQAYLAAAQGRYGVWIQELGSGRTLQMGQDTALEAASVIKVPEALYLLHQVDAGAIKLTDQVTLQQGDFMGGTGILYGRAHPGDQVSYQDLLTDLIRYSDNTAWQALMRTLGAGSIDAYAASLGAPDCRQKQDSCTAREAGSLFAKLASGSPPLSSSSTQLLLGLLKSTVFNDRINYYLPGVAVAHKVGMDGNVMNDCGIVYQGTGYVVCVFTIAHDPTTGIQAIRDITRAANHFLGH